MTFSTLTHLACPRFGAAHDAAVLHGMCTACQSPLLARYDIGSSASNPKTSHNAHRICGDITNCYRSAHPNRDCQNSGVSVRRSDRLHIPARPI